MTLTEAKIKYQRLLRKIKFGLAALTEKPFVRNYNREFRRQYLSDCKVHGDMTMQHWFENYFDHRMILIKLDQLNNI